MSSRSADKIVFTSYDDLFGEKQAEKAGESVLNLPLSSLHSFKSHPGVQLPVLLLPALYAGAEVRGKLHLFGKRRQGLQRVPGTPPPGELWIYCRQFPEDCWRDGGTGEEGRTVNEGSSLYIPRCT